MEQTISLLLHFFIEPKHKRIAFLETVKMAKTSTNNFETAVALFEMAFRFNQEIGNNHHGRTSKRLESTASNKNITPIVAEKTKREHYVVRNLAQEIEFVLANRSSSSDSSGSDTSPAAKRICRRKEEYEMEYQRQANGLNASTMSVQAKIKVPARLRHNSF